MTEKAPFIPESYHRQNAWDDTWADQLWLLTPDEIKRLPEKFPLTSISKQVVYAENTDDDTRWGYTAYGFLDSQLDIYPYPNIETVEVIDD